MLSIVVIRKTGEVSSPTIRRAGFSLDTLYRRGGFSSAAGFGHLHTFAMEGYNLSLFGKREGRHNMINKFDLPPPVDTPLFYGSLVVLAHAGEAEQLTGEALHDYTAEMWANDYDHLMGGFEDLAACAGEDSQEEDELAGVDPALKTRSGYLKSEFVADDDEVEMASAGGGGGSEEAEYDFEGDSCSDSDSDDSPRGGVDEGGELVPEEYVPEK